MQTPLEHEQSAALKGQQADAAIHVQLADGSPVCIRRIGPADEDLMREGIARLSPRSRYLRFFAGGSTPPDWVIDRLLDVDGHRHLAWGALDTSADPSRSSGPAIGAVHAFRGDGPSDCAEFSVAIVDEWQGRGLGRLLTALLLQEAHQQGMECLRADTLRENQSAVDFMVSLGGRGTGGDPQVRSFQLDIGRALEILRNLEVEPALNTVLRQTTI